MATYRVRDTWDALTDGTRRTILASLAEPLRAVGELAAERPRADRGVAAPEGAEGGWALQRAGSWRAFSVFTERFGDFKLDLRDRTQAGVLAY